MDDVPAALKQGILDGHGGSWNLSRQGTPAKPYTGLHNGNYGWHSGKDHASLQAANAIIHPRMNDRREASPSLAPVTQPPALKGKGVAAVNASYASADWRKRLDKILADPPYAKGVNFPGRLHISVL
jgi:hypothetical protein